MLKGEGTTGLRSKFTFKIRWGIILEKSPAHKVSDRPNMRRLKKGQYSSKLSYISCQF